MNLLILGGDKRQEILKGFLGESHNVTHYYKFDDLNKSYNEFDMVILPYPATKDGKNLYNSFSENNFPLEEIDKKISFQKVLSGGKVPIKNSIDYAQNEMLLMLNAAATAEAAIAIAVNNTKITLQESRILIIGNGRIGKLLASRLSGFKTNITVSARNIKDFGYLEAFGIKYINTNELCNHIGNFDIIFNTVPSTVLSESALKKCNKNAVLIELASHPYGFDGNIAQKLGLKVIMASALPGKTAPLTAAKNISRAINDLLTNKGEII